MERNKSCLPFLQDAVTLCSYPFIFDAQAKTKMLQTDAELQMQVIFLSLSFPATFLFLCLLQGCLHGKGVNWELVRAALYCFYDTGEQCGWRTSLTWILQRQCLVSFPSKCLSGNIRTARCACGGNLNCIGEEKLCIYDSPRIRSKVRPLLEDL